MSVVSRRRRVRETEPRTGTPTISFYLESSALLAGLLENDVEVIRGIDPSTTALSVLTIAEARRGVQRSLAGKRIDTAQASAALATIAQLEASCTLLAITDTILARVGRRFPAEPIRTLDAIHLATAEMIDAPEAPVTILTRDRRIRENAERMGLPVA